MESGLQAEVQGKVMEIRREGTPALCPGQCAKLYRTGVKRQNKLEVATVKYAENRGCVYLSSVILKVSYFFTLIF